MLNTRQARPRLFWTGLAVAAALHLGLLAVSLQLGDVPRATPSAAHDPVGIDVDVEIDLDLYPGGGGDDASSAEPPSPPISAAPETPPPARAARSLAARDRAARSLAARDRFTPQPSDLVAPSAPHPSPEPEAITPSVKADDDRVDGAPEPNAEPLPPAPQRRLSLAELGIGTPLGPDVLAPSIAATPTTPSDATSTGSSGATPESPRRGPGGEVGRAQARLDHALRRGLAERDQKLGLGPEGPLVEALGRLTYLGATAPNGGATFRISLDAEGRLSHAELVGVRGGVDGWDDILRDFIAEFSKRKLPRVPGRGVTLELSVTSREQLPSGASPGLDIDIAGIPIHRGRGPNPTKLSILTPLVVPVPFTDDPDGVKIPAFVFGIGLFGDPTDIGATPRRVVHARLTEYEVH